MIRACQYTSKLIDFIGKCELCLCMHIVLCTCVNKGRNRSLAKCCLMVRHLFNARLADQCVDSASLNMIDFKR